MKSISERRENAILLVAYASLKAADESTNRENVYAEAARIERIIAQEYVEFKGDVEYNQFALDFIKKNAEEIVYGDKYSFDVAIADEYTDLDVNQIIR
jgi:hypothetical protein